jgi:hypothetical protein
VKGDLDQLKAQPCDTRHCVAHLRLLHRAAVESLSLMQMNARGLNESGIALGMTRLRARDEGFRAQERTPSLTALATDCTDLGAEQVVYSPGNGVPPPPLLKPTVFPM